MLSNTARQASAVVLDTNTALDWLVFQEPRVAPLVFAIEQGQLHWLACPAMRAELARTLAYRSLEKWRPNTVRSLSVFDRWARMCPTPPPAPLNLRCSDADDQVFLDLALAEGSPWLLSHDRALLRLARRTLPLGLAIQNPWAWCRLHPAAAALVLPTP